MEEANSDKKGQSEEASVNSNYLDTLTRLSLTSIVPYAWVCSLPFLLSGVATGVICIVFLWKAFDTNALFSPMLIISCIVYALPTYLTITLGLRLARFAKYISKYRDGDETALRNAICSLGDYFKLQATLIGISLILSVFFLVMTFLFGMTFLK